MEEFTGTGVMRFATVRTLQVPIASKISRLEISLLGDYILLPQAAPPISHKVILSELFS